MPFEFVVEGTDMIALADAIKRSIAEQQYIVEQEFRILARPLLETVSRNTPVGATGNLATQINATITRTQTEVILAIHQSARSVAGIPYVKAVSGMDRQGGGRKPGKMPPYMDLADWVRIKLRVPDKQIKRVAWLIARSIGVKGTRGNPYYLKVVQESAPLIQETADRIGQEIAVRLTSTKFN
jgi:hypothetical protein